MSGRPKDDKDTRVIEAAMNFFAARASRQAQAKCSVKEQARVMASSVMLLAANKICMSRLYLATSNWDQKRKLNSAKSSQRGFAVSVAITSASRSLCLSNSVA